MAGGGGLDGVPVFGPHGPGAQGGQRGQREQQGALGTVVQAGALVNGQGAPQGQAQGLGVGVDRGAARAGTRPGAVLGFPSEPWRRREEKRAEKASLKRPLVRQ